jgi:SAM-dependent methyltransferase
VLDVGSGEGHWRSVLRRLRPGIRYYGVDPSEYVVKRFGRRRNIRLGTLGTLKDLSLPKAFDLIVCCGVLNYVPNAEFPAGLRTLRSLARGPIYLEVFAREDDAEGDFQKRAAKPAAWYRRVMQEAGLVACGMQFYVPRELEHLTSALERAR